MSTTIRLPRSLKARLDKISEIAGLTAHAFNLQSVSDSAESQERQQHFYQISEVRFERIAEGENGWLGGNETVVAGQ